MSQAKSQRDREASKGQDEHVHSGAFDNGTDVSRDVSQARQAHGSEDGSSASQDYTRSCYVLHRGTLQTGLSQRSRAQDPHSSGEKTIKFPI